MRRGGDRGKLPYPPLSFLNSARFLVKPTFAVQRLTSRLRCESSSIYSLTDLSSHELHHRETKILARTNLLVFHAPLCRIPNGYFVRILSILRSEQSNDDIICKYNYILYHTRLFHYYFILR